MSWVDAMAALIATHPHWAGVLVFFVAASEAVVLVGMIIPGTPILLAVGGVIGLGHLPLMPILLWAAAGAIAGDGFSYWLGHTYREGLRQRWPFSRYPELIDRGERFFRRHGGKSVILGRFIPVLKPVVPAVAGIVGMPPLRFYVANALSAVIWSPAHILPGVLVGASLGLLHGVSPRLFVAAIAILVAVVLIVWSARIAVVGIGPVLGRAHRWAFERACAHPGTLAHRLLAPFDPDHPGTPALVATLVILVAALLGFIWVFEDVLTGESLVQADRAISHFVTGLRNPWTDPAMIVVTSLGDSVVTASIALTILAWLAVHRAWRLVVVVISALILTGISVPLLKVLVHVPRPEAMYSGIDTYSFPSGHTAMAATLYALAAWLIAGGLGVRARGGVYAASLAWVLCIAVSRIYLGAHWPSDVMAGFFLGTAIVAMAAGLYRNPARDGIRASWLAIVLVLTLAVAGLVHVERSYQAQLARYVPREAFTVIGEFDWWGGRWRDLPARRIDLAGESEEPLVLQWLGSPRALEARLLAVGWTRPPAWTLANAAGFLKPGTALAALPVLPTLQDGREPVLVLVKPGDTPNLRWVLRAWRTDVEITGDGIVVRPLLVASFMQERETHPGRMLSVVRAAAQQAPPPASFFTALEAVRVERDAHDMASWLASDEHGSASNARRVQPESGAVESGKLRRN